MKRIPILPVVIWLFAAAPAGFAGTFRFIYRGTSADRVNGIFSATTITHPHESDVTETHCVGSICAAGESLETPGRLDVAVRDEADRGPAILIDWDHTRAVLGATSERLLIGRLYLVAGADLVAEDSGRELTGTLASPLEVHNSRKGHEAAFQCYTESGWVSPVWPKPLLLCSPETSTRTSHPVGISSHDPPDSE